MFSSIFFSVPPLLASNGIAYAFKESDGLGQGICVLLLIISVGVWYIMLEKAGNLISAMKKSQAFLRAFREKRNPLGLKEKAAESNSPAAAVYLAACERIESFHLEQPGGGRRAMSDDELEVMRSAMNQAVEDQLVILQSRTMVLATAVSGSPFLGLFGTVWGITVAFTKLAQAGKADVQTLAPGVSGALLTTVIALFVALPSMVGLNIISSKIKDITVHLDSFVDEVYAKFKIEQLDSYRAAGEQE